MFLPDKLWLAVLVVLSWILPLDCNAFDYISFDIKSVILY